MELLNQKLFDENNMLRDDVRQSMFSVESDVTNSLKEDYDFDLGEHKLVFTGSFTGLNWDDQSDIDLHFLIDFSKFEEPELTKAFLDLYKQKFNEKEATISGHSLEIYFQDINEEHRSPGFYDVTDNLWIREPDMVKYEVTDEMNEKAEEFFDEIRQLESELPSVKDYHAFAEKLKSETQKIKDYRTEGLESEDGMYSFQNIVFKQLRRNGALELLTKIKEETNKNLYELTEAEKKGLEKIIGKVDPRIKLYKTLEDGTLVYIIDGKIVRDDIDTEFIGGGHHYVYSYIPKNEIWLEDLDDKDKILLHEVREREKMQEGWGYVKAHNRANRIESRKRTQEVKGSLK